MNLDAYKRRLNGFERVLQNMCNVTRELNMNGATEKAHNILSRLKNDAFHLVIVGEFSRGKSTFVNALLGRKILPASKKPTTAIISKIVYGDTPDYYIHFKGKQTPKHLEEDEFIKLTAPREPDETDEKQVEETNKQQEYIDSIDYAEIFYPLPFCRDNVEIVDTPGTNDLNVGRMKITYEYLNRADACVLLLSATQPLSKSEKEFLLQHLNKVDDIFFVISGKDKLNGDKNEEREVLEFINKNLREILPPEFTLYNRIFLVSSLAALVYRRHNNGEELSEKKLKQLPDDFDLTGFPAFESALTDFLANEKGTAKLKKYLREMKHVLQNVQHDIKVNIGVVSHSADELKQKVANMQPKFEQSRQRAERIIGDMRQHFEHSGLDIEERCKNAGTDIRLKAKHAVNDLEKDMSTNQREHVIEGAVAEFKRRFTEETLSRWKNIFDEEYHLAQRELQKIWNDMDVEYQREFNLPTVIDNNRNNLTLTADEPEDDFSSNAYRDAGKYLSEVFDGRKSLLGRLWSASCSIGALIFGAGHDLISFARGKQRKDWREKVRDEVDRHYKDIGTELAKTMRKTYNAQVATACEKIQLTVNERIKDMEEQLQAIIREKETTEQNASRTKNYLEQKLHALYQIEQTLNNIVRR